MIVAIQQGNAHSIHSKANFYGASHSALIQIKSYRQLKDPGEVPGFAIPFLVEAETREIYYGDVPEQFEYIFWGPPGYDPKSRGFADKTTILSFCKSKNGMFYMYENFAHIPATRGNIGDFQKMSKANNSSKDDHNCKSNFPYYNPDNYNPLE